MLKLWKTIGAAAFIACVASCASYAPIDVEESIFTREEVAEDLNAFIEFVEATHPNIAYAADPVEIDAVAAQVRQSLHDDMTSREAWMAMALMNPVFMDAHVGLRRPPMVREAFENGGRLFPAPVLIDDCRSIRFGGAVLESAGVEAGDELISINGIEASDIIDMLAPRMRGNSSALACLIMERYFSQYFWIAYGEFDRYAARVKSRRGIRTVTLPSDIPGANEDKSPFVFEKLAENVAYMDIATFDIGEKERFEDFVANAFAQIEQDKVDTLIIDLRKNGGGAHDVSDLLMAYLTDKPYSPISRVTARITEENVDRIPGAKLGAVVTLPFQLTVEPPKDLPNRFNGDAYALIGGLTYSQAIAFASTLQDYELATIVGEETEGRANQSGQVQLLTLPNTGFEALAPIYIFTRASGEASKRGVIPDIEIENDPLDPMASVNVLLRMLESQVR